MSFASSHPSQSTSDLCSTPCFPHPLLAYAGRQSLSQGNSHNLPSMHQSDPRLQPSALLSQSTSRKPSASNLLDTRSSVGVMQPASGPLKKGSRGMLPAHQALPKSTECPEAGSLHTRPRLKKCMDLEECCLHQALSENYGTQRGIQNESALFINTEGPARGFRGMLTASGPLKECRGSSGALTAHQGLSRRGSGGMQPGPGPPLRVKGKEGCMKQYEGGGEEGCCLLLEGDSGEEVAEGG
eukprot:scaffold240327_cov19-Tisochrysis_lutea.AAC.1